MANEATLQAATKTSEPVSGLQWLEANRRLVTAAAVGIVVLGGSVWFMMAARERRERVADQQLQIARSSIISGNLPLAANDLSRLVSSFPGTNAAKEGAVLLGLVRLLQEDAALAVAGLREFVQSSPESYYQAAGYRLLGSALEETLQYAEASAAWEQASNTEAQGFLKATALVEAARTAVLAGDSARALTLYRRVLGEFEGVTGSAEAIGTARVRLAELEAALGAL